MIINYSDPLIWTTVAIGSAFFFFHKYSPKKLKKGEKTYIFKSFDEDLRYILSEALAANSIEEREKITTLYKEFSKRYNSYCFYTNEIVTHLLKKKPSKNFYSQFDSLN